MTSLWFRPIRAPAIAVAGPMTVTVAVAVTIPSRIHRRVSSVRMMKPPNKAEEEIEHTIRSSFARGGRAPVVRHWYLAGGGAVLLRAIWRSPRTPGQTARPRASCAVSRGRGTKSCLEQEGGDEQLMTGTVIGSLPGLPGTGGASASASCMSSSSGTA